MIYFDGVVVGLWSSWLDGCYFVVPWPCACGGLGWYWVVFCVAGLASCCGAHRGRSRAAFQRGHSGAEFLEALKTKIGLN